MNQQEPTGINEGNPYEKLEPKHRRAIDLRLEFFKYKYIAGDLKLEEQTVRAWFMTDGVCYAAYQFKVAERAKENEEMAAKIRQELSDLTPEAITVIKTNLSKGNLEAALKVLAINGIVEVHKFEVDDKNKEKIDTIGKFINQIGSYAKKITDRGDTATS